MITECNSYLPFVRSIAQYSDFATCIEGEIVLLKALSDTSTCMELILMYSLT